MRVFGSGFEAHMCVAGTCASSKRTISNDPEHPQLIFELIVVQLRFGRGMNALGYFRGICFKRNLMDIAVITGAFVLAGYICAICIREALCLFENTCRRS